MRSNNKGFTLIEILISVSIFSLLFSYILGVLVSGLSTSKDAETRMDIEETGRFIIQRISKDLESASELPLSKTGSLLGKMQMSNGKRMDEIHFTSFANLYRGTGRPTSGSSEIGYYFIIPSEGNAKFARRESSIIEGRIDVGGISFEITDKIKEFQIRYLSPDKAEGWTDAWEYDIRKKMPKSVAVELTLEDRGRDYFFSTVVRLPA